MKKLKNLITLLAVAVFVAVLATCIFALVLSCTGWWGVLALAASAMWLVVQVDSDDLNEITVGWAPEDQADTTKKAAR